MKTLYRILFITGFIVFASCQSASTISQSSSNKREDIVDCKAVAPTERLTCIGAQRIRDHALINDPGKLIDQKIVDHDTYCMRVEQTWERGESLPEKYRTREVNTFTVCRYGTFWERLKDHTIWFGIGYISGFATGFGISK